MFLEEVKWFCRSQEEKEIMRDNDYNILCEKQCEEIVEMTKDNGRASDYRVLMLVNVLLKFVFLSSIYFSVRKE